MSGILMKILRRQNTTLRHRLQLQWVFLIALYVLLETIQIKHESGNMRKWTLTM
jgi:hypothetical protein